MIGSRFVACKFVLFVFVAACWAREGGSVVWYHSPIDATEQGYGVYMPSAPAPPGGYPAIFHAHGYGWHVSGDFSPWQRSWADEHGWVLININARGPTFYEGIGQQAVYEVVADACARFGLNRSRLYFTGASMGGTGAFRVGVRDPHIFAAVVSVDGWTDWREWHWHWYARTDMRDDIEEFRRPLLNSASSLYWAERAMWGRIKAIADGRDDVVLPDNSLRLTNRLLELAATQPGGYSADIVLNYDRGHGGGYDLASIYDFFLRTAPAQQGHRLRLLLWTLDYPRQGWVEIKQIRAFGQPAVVESLAAGGCVSLWTDNVEGVAVMPGDVPDIDGTEPCQVWIDGRLVYEGLPRMVSARAVFDAAGNLTDWQVCDKFPRAPEKRPGLAGPIGNALVQPFAIVYATDGASEHTARHRHEAEAFARAWTDFFVHGPGPLPTPEDSLTTTDLAARNIVLFGCLDCSRLLRSAHRAYSFPIEVRDKAVIVHDASGSVRRYLGPQFGAFVVYPNPLVDFRRYVLVCSGRWNTKPDSYVPAGLDYDMEKLPWGYPDYVVFNMDQAQLPFVLNVNNKPPVTCYEAAYFVEAGYFNNHWRLGPDCVTEWVKALKPERTRLIHVAQVDLSEGFGVRVVTANGEPVPQARVTVGDDSQARSAVTDSDGWAHLAGFGEPQRVRVLSVMATACAYDRSSDCADAASPPNRAGDLAVLNYTGPLRARLDGDCVQLEAQVTSLASSPVDTLVRVTASRGRVRPATRALTLVPGAKATLTWSWMDGCSVTGPVSIGLDLRATCGSEIASTYLKQSIEVCSPEPAQLTLVEPKTSRSGSSWKITVNVANISDSALQARVRAFVIQAAWPCEDQVVCLAPGEEREIAWIVPPEAARRHQGLTNVLIYAPGLAAWAKTDLVLDFPGGANLASMP